MKKKQTKVVSSSNECISCTKKNKKARTRGFFFWVFFGDREENRQNFNFQPCLISFFIYLIVTQHAISHKKINIITRKTMHSEFASEKKKRSIFRTALTHWVRCALWLNQTKKGLTNKWQHCWKSIALSKCLKREKSYEEKRDIQKA